jgi:hypothetical protein
MIDEFLGDGKGTKLEKICGKAVNTLDKCGGRGAELGLAPRKMGVFPQAPPSISAEYVAADLGSE